MNSNDATTVAEAPRLPPLDPPYDADVQRDFDAIMPPGVPPLALFRTLAHSPRVMRKLRLGGLLDRGAISLREREIVILRTTANLRSEYEWGVHVAIFAQKAQLTQAQVAATTDSPVDETLWTPRERLLLRLVDELSATATVSDELWRALHDSFAAEQLVELVALIGYYHGIAFFTNAFAIELEPDAPRFGSRHP